MKNLTELDFSKEIKASTTTTCDSCGKVVGESYARSKGSISIHLQEKEEAGEIEKEYPEYEVYHFCSEACLCAKLNERAGK
jgi:DNA-directed RNA polymerase subunit N (RpoN/RPB10)